jgi:hypothetical protein
LERWLGISVSGDKVTLVEGTVDGDAPLIIVGDRTLKLQSGDRALAYKTLYGQVADYVEHVKLDKVIIKASTANQRGMGKAHLLAAELRGVVIAAAATNAPVKQVATGYISNNFGKRKFDEYLADDSFWTSEVAGVSLRKGSRDAALLLIHARG